MDTDAPGQGDVRAVTLPLLQTKGDACKAGRRRWFTEGGDTEFIDTEEYLNNAVR